MGAVVGSGSSNDDVFLNLGRDYSDAERFQIVLCGFDCCPDGRTGLRVIFLSEYRPRH